jgi:hypothetical protein
MAVTLPKTTVDRPGDGELLELVVEVCNSTVRQDMLSHYGRTHQTKPAGRLIPLPR